MAVKEFASIYLDHSVVNVLLVFADMNAISKILAAQKRLESVTTVEFAWNGVQNLLTTSVIVPPGFWGKHVVNW